MSRFREPAVYQAATADWQLLPFRFERITGRVLLTNLIGEHLFLKAEEFDQLAASDLPTD